MVVPLSRLCQWELLCSRVYVCVRVFVCICECMCARVCVLFHRFILTISASLDRENDKDASMFCVSDILCKAASLTEQWSR